jgi:hypothetical protein
MWRFRVGFGRGRKQKSLVSISRTKKYIQQQTKSKLQRSVSKRRRHWKEEVTD